MTIYNYICHYFLILLLNLCPSKWSFWYDLVKLLFVFSVTSKDILICVYIFQINSAKTLLRIQEFKAELSWLVINNILNLIT